MTSSTSHPRADQIDALTRGIPLPLPAIDAAHLEIIADGIFRAFHEVRKDYPTVVSSGGETEVTALLEAQLNNLLIQDCIWQQLVHCAARGKESVSFDGAHLEKRPDISIYLSRRPSNFPLIVEAKVLDASSGKTPALYCDKGLNRFLTGEYAWASQEAYLMAYVRDDTTISKDLTSLFSKDLTEESPRYAVQKLPAAKAMGQGELAYSLHGRVFEYPHRVDPDNNPGPISVWHLWLR